MGIIKPMQVGYLYTNEKKKEKKIRQRNKLWRNEYCTSAEMATLGWEISQVTAAESGEGFGVLWGMVWKPGDQLLPMAMQEANRTSNAYHVRPSY